MGEDLVRGEIYDLEMKFTVMSTDEGLLKGSYVHMKANESRHFVHTHFRPVFGRNVFPCMDEPHFKTKFIVSIGRPDNTYSLSNNAKIESVPM